MFTTAILGIIVLLLNSALDYMDNMLVGIVPTALYAEVAMTKYLNVDVIGHLFNYFYGIGVSLILLKFIYKGLNVYVFWDGGDPDTDPMIFLTGFVKAMVIAISFPTLYKWLADIIMKSTDDALYLLTGYTESQLSGMIEFVSGGLFTAILGLIFIVLYFILYIQFLTRGVEILILRIGLPLACSGLLDADKGMFKPYIQKFFQSTVAVLVQIILAKLGIGLALNAHFFWSIAVVIAALRTPRFLQEFLLVSGGGMNVGSVYQSVRLAQTAKRMFAK